jgi:hypothetical protein
MVATSGLAGFWASVMRDPPSGPYHVAVTSRRHEETANGGIVSKTGGF